MFSKPMLLTGFLMVLLCIMVGVFIYDGKPKQQENMKATMCDPDIVKMHNLIKTLITNTDDKELLWKIAPFSEGYSFSTNYKTAHVTVYQFMNDCTRIALRVSFTIRNQDKMVYSDEFTSLNSLLKSIHTATNFDASEFKPNEVIQNQFDILVHSLTMKK